MPRHRIHVQIDGLVAVHAVRAVRTALAAVPGVQSAEVSMAGAILECEGEIDAVFEAALRHALDAAGVAVRTMRVERGPLPLL